MRDWKKLSIFFILTCTSIYFAVYFFALYLDYKEQKTSYESFNKENWINPLENTGITDNDYIYQDDEPLQVDEIYITVLKPQEKSTEKIYNFKDLITESGENNSKLKVEIFFEDGDKKIFQNGIFLNEPNATLELRGKVSEKILQKSFKIRLFDKEGLWHNQNIVDLNKEYSDPLRIRNKLSFDYFKIIPNITSLRTRFVRLFIKDLSTEVPSDSFEDYGFYTQIEQPNKLFLQNHGLNPKGALYKAENFRFFTYSDQLKTKEDSTYAKKEFEQILEIKGNDDHQKLINMLEDINDYGKDINEVFDIYFDKENYLTWVAINILFDNYKTANNNFLLYSPLNSNKWYFMPWDYNEAWGLETDRPKWQKGLAMYWDNALHQRVFKEIENVKALNKKIEELLTIVNEEQTKAFLDSYYNILLANITKIPDLKYLPVTLDDYKWKYEELPILTERNYLYYHELLENPMPFYLKESKRNGNKYIFTWDKSYDIQDDNLYYDFELSTDKNFSNVIKNVKDVKNFRYELENLEKGIYYWRVIVRDEKGNSQIAFNTYRDGYGDKYYGIEKLDTEVVGK